MSNIDVRFNEVVILKHNEVEVGDDSPKEK